MSLCTIVRMVLFLPLAMSALAQPYTAQKTTADGIPVVRLNDNERGIVVSIAPTVGNNAYEMIVGGRNVFWFPYESVADFAREPKLCGNKPPGRGRVLLRRQALSAGQTSRQFAPRRQWPSDPRFASLSA